MSDEPISLAAVRAERADNGALWGPEDVLKDAAARSHGADAMIVIWRTKSADGVTITKFSQCGPDVHTVLGMMAAVSQDIYGGRK